MKLPSYLVRNRHGVYYFRLTFLVDSVRKEKRWSLRTKDSFEAKQIALLLSASLRENIASTRYSRFLKSDSSLALLRQQILKIGRNGMEEDNFIGLVTTFHSRNGTKLTMNIDQSDPKDIAAAKKMAKVFLAEEQSQQGVSLPSINIQDFPALHTESKSSDKTIQYFIDRYKTRNSDEVSKKTLYEYEGMQKKFATWVAQRKGTDTFPIHLITREDIAEFINDTKESGISLQTIQKKYLAAIGAIFDLAQSFGNYPKGDRPTSNHKIFNQRAKKKAKDKYGWKPFTKEDLVAIFNPTNLLSREKPCDYWLPLLGLFTGGRISELCQLKVHNIKPVEGIWAIDINDDDSDQSVKTGAGIRIIPLHPQLIELGFLDYLADVRPYNGTIFPYMTPDKFNHYGKTPSRRFGEYLQLLGINDERKVFHSFRSTSNDRLKQNGVPEESRCQFIGHEHDTVNSQSYSTEHKVNFLQEHVSSKLTFPEIDFNGLQFQREVKKLYLEKLMRVAESNRLNKEAREARDHFF